MAMEASSSAAPLTDSSSAHDGNTPSWSDGLWAHIDEAERHLICSQYDEAAELSATLLRELSEVQVFPGHLEGTHSFIDLDEVEDMIESAGMVSIQAYSESGRSSKILIDLESIFGSLAKIPSSLFLSGVCLQISAGFYAEAKVSLESFLDHWAFTSLCAESCMFKPSSEQSHKSLCLKPKEYIQMSKLYSVQVLGKGLKTIDAAMRWVDKADIPTDIKQDLKEELKRVSLGFDRKDSRDLVIHYKVTEGTAKAGACVDSFFNNPAISEGVELKDKNLVGKQACKEDNVQSLGRTFHFCSPTMKFLSGWMTSSVNCSMYSSRWQKVLAVFHQKKALFSGAAMVFLLIALHKQRSKLSRVLAGLGRVSMNFSRAIFVMLFDFWQLAFSVQLNPLAAVQPLPSAQHVR
eukprot:c28993_g1_i1 orf=685-1902(-)